MVTKHKTNLTSKGDYYEAASHEQESCRTEYYYRCDVVVGLRPQAEC